jgi:septal ring factor EnvC (AmiA/AmiB activator)
MLRKVIATSTAALLISFSFGISPASAAVIKNGTPCPTAGVTKKVSGTTYKCVKNLLVTNSKLTYRSSECITSMNAFVRANKDVTAARTATTTTIASVDLAITSLQESLTAITPGVLVEIKIQQDKINASQAKMDVLKADIVNATKNAKDIKDYDTAIRWRNVTITRLNNQLKSFTSQITRLNSEKRAAQNNLGLISSASSTARTTANTICR